MCQLDVVYLITFAEQYIYNPHSISYIRCRPAIQVVYTKGGRSVIMVSQCMGMGAVILYNTTHRSVQKIPLSCLHRNFLFVVSTPCNYETQPAPMLESLKRVLYVFGHKKAQTGLTEWAYCVLEYGILKLEGLLTMKKVISIPIKGVLCTCPCSLLSFQVVYYLREYWVTVVSLQFCEAYYATVSKSKYLF